MIKIDDWDIVMISWLKWREKEKVYVHKYGYFYDKDEWHGDGGDYTEMKGEGRKGNDKVTSFSFDIVLQAGHLSRI